MELKIEEKKDEIKIITRTTINRLLKDVRNIIKSPLTDNGIYYSHDEEDILKGYALIIGPEDTPYFGGFYFFEFNFSNDYPHSPPVVKYHTNGDNIRFNPNLYKCGKVCISLLNTWRGEQWSSCQSISTILLNLCTLLCKEPLLNEPGILKTHPDFYNYNKIIQYKNIELAILQMVNKKKNVYNEKFDMFYPYVLENFTKNSPKILKYLESQQTKPEFVNSSIYSMNVLIDYNTLLENYKNVLKIT